MGGGVVGDGNALPFGSRLNGIGVRRGSVEVEGVVGHDDGAVLADVEEEAGAHEAGDEAAAAVGDEGERHAGDGEDAEADHDVEEGLSGVRVMTPTAMSLPKGSRVAAAISMPAVKRAK